MDELSPHDIPTLARMVVFEDCVTLVLENGSSILLHVSDPKVRGTVLRFYHTNGVLWRAVAVEELNPGWVIGHYEFRGDLRKFGQRQASIRGRTARSAHHQHPTFWATGGWKEAIVYTATLLTWRIQEWQHSPLTTPQVMTPDKSQAQALTIHPMCACW